MECSPSGSSVHGILQARTLKWVSISFSRGSSEPGDQTWVSGIASRFLTSELPGIPKYTSENKNKNQLLLKAGGGEERKQRWRGAELHQESDSWGAAGTGLPGQGGLWSPRHTLLRDGAPLPPLLCVLCSPGRISAFLQPEAVTQCGVLGENLAESMDGGVLSQCIDSKPFHVFKNRSTSYNDLLLLSG